MSAKPLAIDLFAGLGGWTDGLLAEGYEVTGYDIEEHVYGDMRYPAELVLQDVCTLRGEQFKGVDLIVASPPCQEYSYMAMPWSKAKAKAAAIRADETGEKLAALTRLFHECFRIQREASFAAGHLIPMVVENVKGAQPWVGRARANFGSFYFWGDVPALMPKAYQSQKNTGGSWFNIAHNTTSGKANNHVSIPAKRRDNGIKGSEGYDRDHPAAFGWKKPNTSSHSNARKAASARIAMIPPEISTWIGKCFKPISFDA